MALTGRFATQTNFQGKTSQSITGESLQVAQSSSQGANAVKSSGSEYEATQHVIISDSYVETPIGLASAALGQGAAIRAGAGQRLQSIAGGAFAGFAVADAERASVCAIKQAILGSEIQLWIVEEQAHRNTANLAALILAQ